MITVYTAITGGKDELRPPLVIRPDVRYIAFMDVATQIHGWEVRPAEDRFLSPRLNAKAHKVMPHIYIDDAEVTLWVDGTHLPTELFLDSIPFFLMKSDIAVFVHPWRDCLYEEGNVCAASLLDSPLKIRHQLFAYQALGHPAHSGLFATGVLLRRDSPLNRRLSWYWWRQIRRYSERDQISFPFVVRALQLNVELIPGHIYNSPWFDYNPHRR